MRLFRVAGLALLVVLLILVGAAGGAYLAVDATLPATEDRAEIPGLLAPVAITFDADGIPRIRAGNDADAAAALGFVHARDRFAQMDLMRRAAGGDLAELIGPRGVPLDEYARVLGTRGAARRALAALPPRTRTLLDAYARGVNAFLDERRRFAAPEYLLLGTPRRWSPADSMLWAEAMGLALSDNLATELERLALSAQLGRDAILRLWPVGQPAYDSDAASLAPAPGLARLAQATLAALPRFPAPFTEPDLASNAWAVDGAHSRTGAPLLAGDPHLAYGLPCLWYLARIDTPAGTLAGATAPGVPFLVMGRNSRIAWSFTTAGADTEDVFIERVVDADRYAGPAGPLPFRHRIERIHVRGRRDVVLDVRMTRHGPVISDLPALFGVKHQTGAVLTARVASLEDGNHAALGLEMLNAAHDRAEAGKAAAAITAPVQNLLVADAVGIALFTTGRVPIRAAGDGAFPVPGWDNRHEWTGYAEGDALPRIVDPASGVLVNANEPVSDTASQVFMTRDAVPDWRAARIHALLSRKTRFSVDDFASMQGDVTSTFVASLLPHLRLATARDETASASLRAFEGWDGTMDANRPEPFIADAWIRALEEAVLARAGDKEGLAAQPTLLLLRALHDDDTTLCGGACADLVSATLVASVDAIARDHGTRLEHWAWGGVHEVHLRNPLWGGLPVLGRWAGRDIPVGGDGTTIDAQGIRAPGYAAVHGASYRGVYDLRDLDRSRFVILSGESGNPFSRHLLDFTPRWQHVGTVTLGPRADTVAATLALRPAHSVRTH